MKKIIIILISFIVFTSCSDWLDINPKTAINAKKLFEKEMGFNDAITGFYISLGSTSLYGKELSYGYIEYLSANYDNYPDFINIKPEEVYEYKGISKSKQKTINLEMYNIIANINNFLFYLDKNKDVFKSEDTYKIMKAEALGLRAFIHFDLYRMFGPIYKGNEGVKSISYRKSFDKIPEPRLTSKDFVDDVIEDLKTAEDILNDVDTKVFFGDTWRKDYDPMLHQRQLRMNIYAVKAILARVYLYIGDENSKKEALKYANQVIESNYFSLYKKFDSPIMYKENIFSLHVYELEKIIKSNFSANPNYPASLTDHVYVKEENFNYLYDINKGITTDFRSQKLAFRDVEDEAKSFKYCLKYEQSAYNGDDTEKEIIPLIRLPEMYYIVAECETDPLKSAEALNTVRWARGISYTDEILVGQGYDLNDLREGYDKNHSVRINEIMKEYRKEFFAEGYLFYFYKRHNYKTFWRCPIDDMTSKYKWPLPDNEISFGNNN